MAALAIPMSESAPRGGFGPSQMIDARAADKVTQARRAPRPGVAPAASSAAAAGHLRSAVAARQTDRGLPPRRRLHTFTEGRLAALARQPAPRQGADEWEEF